MSGARPHDPPISRPADAPARAGIGAALGRLLPPFAILVLAGGVALTLAVAGDTLGYDFLAYHAAAVRVLDGQPAYDMSFEAAGGFGLFYYPPTFVPFVLPFGLLSAASATWAWLALLLAAFLVGAWAMPVRGWVRWLTVLLAGVSWPFLYAMKLGQVGPMLFLMFALGWRWLDRGPLLGVTGALGAAIKIQPGLVLFWALLTRRWSAVLTGGVALLVIAAIATLVAGVGSWGDFLVLVGRVSDPITTPKNLTLGAVAYALGVSPDAASLLQWASMAAALVAVVVTALRLPAAPSYLVAVVASQLLSPILWEHYALLLLLPVAWLVDRGHWWAVAIPLLTPLFLVGVVPPVVYPLAFWGTLVVVALVGSSGRGDAVLASAAPA